MPPSSRPPEDCVPGTSRTGSLVGVVFDDPIFPDGPVCLGILDSISGSIVADKRGADAMVLDGCYIGCTRWGDGWMDGKSATS